MSGAVSTGLQSTLLDAMGEELVVVFPIDLHHQGDTKEGGKEAHTKFLLQGLEECGYVGNHMLGGVAFSNDTEGLHRTHLVTSPPSQHSSFCRALPMKLPRYRCPLK